MVFSLQIKVDTKSVQRQLDDMAKRQLPFVISRTNTALAKQAVTDIQSNMKSAFSDPSPFTLRGFYAKPGKKGSPDAYVLSSDYAPKGTPAIKYLWPQIMGGPRDPKPYEKALARVGVTGGQQFALPANRAMSRGQIVQALSRFAALNDPTQNLADKTTARLRKKGLTVAASKHRHEYFVARAHGNGRPMGIFKLVGKGKVEPVFWFRQVAPNYQVRLPVEKIIQDSVTANFQSAFAKALADAIRTSKR